MYTLIHEAYKQSLHKEFLELIVKDTRILHCLGHKLRCNKSSFAWNENGTIVWLVYKSLSRNHLTFRQEISVVFSGQELLVLLNKKNKINP